MTPKENNKIMVFVVVYACTVGPRLRLFLGPKKTALTENALINLINRKLGFQTTFGAVLDHLEQHKWSHLRDDIKTFRMELHIHTKA